MSRNTSSQSFCEQLCMSGCLPASLCCKEALACSLRLAHLVSAFWQGSESERSNSKCGSIVTWPMFEHSPNAF